MGRVSQLTNHFLDAVDMAAIASANWRGKGDKMAADAAAVEAMRLTFDNVPFDGRVAIGEGERDEAPMLYIGEQLGCEIGNPNVPAIDIAVDPLECTTIALIIYLIRLQYLQQHLEALYYMHQIVTWTKLQQALRWKDISV